MFNLYALQVQLEEAEKDYLEAKKNFEEIGVNKETLQRLIITNIARVKARDNLRAVSPKA